MTAEESRLQTLRHARIRRVKQLLKWMPRKANLERYPVLKWFAKAARRRPYLWSFKISSCTPAFYVGSLIAFLPLMGIQILLAFGAALFLRGNLPITIGLQAISNPLTIPFLYPLYFLVGRRTMDFFGFGPDLNPAAGALHALFLGGAIIGLLIGATLDLLYRFMVYEANRHSARRAPKAPKTAAGTPPRPEPAREDLDEVPAQRDKVIR